MIYQAAEKVFAQGIVAELLMVYLLAIAGTLLLLAYAGAQTHLQEVWKRIKMMGKARQPVFFDVYRLVRQE